MSVQKSWLAEVEPKRYQEFVKTFWDALRIVDEDLPEEPPQGVGEVTAGPFPVSYAVDAESKLAAFRWYSSVHDEGTHGWRRLEAFFACPANAKPRAGLRIASSLGNAFALEAPDWWRQDLGIKAAPYEGSPLPGFMELVAILAANGSVSTTSADMQEALSDLRHEVDYYRQLSEEQAEELRQLRAKNRDLLQQQPAARDDEEDNDAEESTEPVKDLSGLPDWALANSSRITILSRALNAAKKSLYSEPATVYEALELLAGPYREHRMGLIDKEAFNDALAASGLQLQGSVAPSKAGEQGDAYFVNWNKRRRFLELHLMKGGGRDERYCLRVYFFWDEDTQQAIVGWLPSHLNNSLT